PRRGHQGRHPDGPSRYAGRRSRRGSVAGKRCRQLRHRQHRRDRRREATAVTPDSQARDLLAMATEIAAEAAVVVERFAAERTYAIETKSSPTDLVTEADRETEALIIERILGARPND